MWIFHKFAAFHNTEKKPLPVWANSTDTQVSNRVNFDSATRVNAEENGQFQLKTCTRVGISPVTKQVIAPRIK